MDTGESMEKRVQKRTVEKEVKKKKNAGEGSKQA